MSLDKAIDSTKLNACCSAEANAIRAKTGGSAALSFDFANDKGFADAIAAIPTGITPSGTISITANGTHDVTSYASANVNVDYVVNCKYYEVENPTAVIGSGVYLTLVPANSFLAGIRSSANLVVRVITEGTISCVRSVDVVNTFLNNVPYVANGVQSISRFTSSGGFNNTGFVYKIYEDTSITTGIGRLYMTADGELRIYANNGSTYYIPSGTIRVYVMW